MTAAPALNISSPLPYILGAVGALFSSAALGARALGRLRVCYRWKCFEGVLEELRVFSEILRVLECS